MNPCLELAADYEAARNIGPWLAASLEQMQVPHLHRLGEIELALHELAINIVDHAYDDTTVASSYTISLSIDDGELLATFCDQGRPFIDERPPASEQPTVGGYGLYVVEQLASSVRYERINTENQWTLGFSPTSSAPALPDTSDSSLEQLS